MRNVVLLSLLFCTQALPAQTSPGLRRPPNPIDFNRLIDKSEAKRVGLEKRVRARTAERSARPKKTLRVAAAEDIEWRQVPRTKMLKRRSPAGAVTSRPDEVGLVLRRKK